MKTLVWKVTTKASPPPFMILKVLSALVCFLLFLSLFSNVNLIFLSFPIPFIFFLLLPPDLSLSFLFSTHTGDTITPEMHLNQPGEIRPPAPLRKPNLTMDSKASVTARMPDPDKFATSGWFQFRFVFCFLFFVCFFGCVFVFCI